MAYLSQSGRSVWNHQQEGLELISTDAISLAVENKTPFTMLPGRFCEKAVRYNWDRLSQEAA